MVSLGSTDAFTTLLLFTRVTPADVDTAVAVTRTIPRATLTATADSAPTAPAAAPAAAADAEATVAAAFDAA